MKHNLKQALATAALLLCSMVAMAQTTATITVDGIKYELDETEKTATVVRSSDVGNIVIPETVEHNGVVCSVTKIRDNAFHDCNRLKSVIIPNSVTTIGQGAFEGCSSLKSITIPNSVTTIESIVFSDCTGLKSIVVESGNTKYDSRKGCNAIIETATNTLIAACKNTVIPNSVTKIGFAAFSGCTGLTNITIPNSVTKIGIAAFSGCTGLKSITIPNSVTTIESIVFSDCTGLKSIVVESGNTKYDSRKGCNAIIETATNTLIAACKNTVIPNSVTTIGRGAFSRCTGLTRITIPNSVITIGDDAFSYCSGLTRITVPNSVTTIGRGAFFGCIGLTRITIPNSVTTIGGGAFFGCIGLTRITIPNSVTTIGRGAFSNCTGLISISVMSEVPPTIEDNIINENDYRKVTLYIPKSSISKYETTKFWIKFRKKQKL